MIDWDTCGSASQLAASCKSNVCPFSCLRFRPVFRLFLYTTIITSQITSKQCFEYVTISHCRHIVFHKHQPFTVR